MHTELIDIKIDSTSYTPFDYNPNTRIVKHKQEYETVYTIQVRVTTEFYDDNSGLLEVAFKDTLYKLNNI